jgi:hypothetical protein
MPPPDLVVDQRLSEARPVADERSFSPLGIAWTDGARRPIADDYRTYMSPAELALQGRWQASDPDNDEYGLQRDPVEVARIACQALALPGTRSDYHQALSWLSHVDGVPGALVERSLLADVELVLGDPADALSLPSLGATRAARRRNGTSGSHQGRTDTKNLAKPDYQRGAEPRTATRNPA